MKTSVVSNRHPWSLLEASLMCATVEIQQGGAISAVGYLLFDILFARSSVHNEQYLQVHLQRNSPKPPMQVTNTISVILPTM